MLPLLPSSAERTLRAHPTLLPLFTVTCRRVPKNLDWQAEEGWEAVAVASIKVGDGRALRRPPKSDDNVEIYGRGYLPPTVWHNGGGG